MDMRPKVHEKSSARATDAFSPLRRRSRFFPINLHDIEIEILARTVLRSVTMQTNRRNTNNP